GTPSAISLANASRLAYSGFRPRRPIATPQPHECCDVRQIPPLDYVPLVPRRQQVDTAIVNGFGFGGQNAVAVFRRFGV
ncbi:MAG: hypothetical protein ACLQBX_12630, partial [Candidatus Limnocylindrales bacterium]